MAKPGAEKKRMTNFHNKRTKNDIKELKSLARAMGIGKKRRKKKSLLGSLFKF